MERASEWIVDDGRLYHLGIGAADVAPNLVVVGDPARALLVAERFDAVHSRVERREFVTLTGTFRGLPVSVIGTGIGTDNVEIALLEAWAALAFDLETARPLAERPPVQVIRVGTSGGARPDLAAGSIVVAEYALGLDATAPYFDHPAADAVVTAIETRAAELLDEAVAARSRFRGRLPVYASRASPELFARLLRQAKARDDAVEAGITVSAPGFYGASSRYIEGLVNTVPDIKGTLARLEVAGRRVLNFEMESSLLFHLAQPLGIACATLCVAISQPGSHHRTINYQARIERCIEIALETLAAGAER